MGEVAGGEGHRFFLFVGFLVSCGWSRFCLLFELLRAGFVPMNSGLLNRKAFVRDRAMNTGDPFLSSLSFLSVIQINNTRGRVEIMVETQQGLTRVSLTLVETLIDLRIRRDQYFGFAIELK